MSQSTADWPRTALLVRESRGHWVGEAAAAVHAAGLRAVLLAPPMPEEEAAALAGVVDGVVAVDDVHDLGALLVAVHETTGGVRPAGMMTGSDGLVAVVAQAAEVLGVARCSAEVFTIARNKHAVRRVLAEAGLPGPRFALIGDAEEAAAVAAHVGLPAIVKPVNGAGSNLVRTVTSVTELADAHRLLAARLPESTDPRYHRSVSGRAGEPELDPARVFLVEGLLRGPEYAIDVLVRDGEVEPVELLDKPLIDEHKFELALSCPPLGLSTERAKVVTDAVCEAVRALGLDNTVAHVEVIDDETAGPTIVEINAGRPAGSIMPLLAKLRTGVDVFAEATSLALGTPPPKREAPSLPIQLGMLILYPRESGRLVAVHGVDEVAELPEVIDVVTTLTPGELVNDDQEVYGVNLVVAGFTDHDDLAALYDEAAKKVRFELEETS